MTAQEALPYIAQLIADNQRHSTYKREVEVADLCRRLLGDTEDQRELLRQFTIMETEAEQEQRQRLSNSITRSVLGPSIAYLDEVIRCDGKTIIIEGPEPQRGKISDHFERFYRGETLLQYCFEAAKYAAKLDPNYWTVFQFKTAVNAANNATAITDIYPIEIPAKAVRDYSFSETGELLYFAYDSLRPVIDTRGNAAQAPEYYLYGIGYVLHLIEVRPEWTEVQDYSAYEVFSSQATDRRQTTFRYRIFNNGTKEVPAIRWSAYLSDIDDNEIGAPLYQDAVPLLLDLIRDKSFFDVSKVLHMRPEKAQFVKPCNAQDEAGEHFCDGGFYGGIRKEEHRCKSCGGTGKLLSTTEQRIVTLAWPERAEDIFDLAKLAHYFDRPIDAVKFFDEQIAQASRSVTLAVFSQQNVDAGSLANVQTATQSRIEYSKINNKLAPFAALIEKAFELAYRVGFNFYNSAAEVALLSFPTDFKLQTLTELMTDLKAARESGSPYPVIDAINRDIMSKAYKNSPEMVDFFASIEKYRPFKSKRPEEVALILQQRATDDPERQLYETWDVVTTEIQETQPAFHLYDPRRQKQVMFDLAANAAGNVKYIDNSQDIAGGLESLFAQLAQGEEEQTEQV